MRLSWGVLAYDGSQFNLSGAETYKNSVHLHLIATDEEEAIKKAKYLVKRSDYRLTDVQEFFDPNEDLKNMRKQPWER